MKKQGDSLPLTCPHLQKTKQISSAILDRHPHYRKRFPLHLCTTSLISSSSTLTKSLFHLFICLFFFSPLGAWGHSWGARGLFLRGCWKTTQCRGANPGTQLQKWQPSIWAWALWTWTSRFEVLLWRLTYFISGTCEKG